MDSLPYVDTLFKEYLLFRGFTATLQSFGAELSADRCCGFQAEALCELIFGQLLPQCRTTQLMELLELLADRLYSQLDGRFEALVERMEVALIKAALVTCVRLGRQEKVGEFFRQHGDALLSGPEAGVWRQWAALAFVPTPRKDPAFQAYFSPEWMNLLEVSFRNFLSQVMASLPLPAVLRFNADRRHRLALQQQVDALQRQLEVVSRQLAAAQVAAEALRHREFGTGKDAREADGIAAAAPSDAAQTGADSRAPGAQADADSAECGIDASSSSPRVGGGVGGDDRNVRPGPVRFDTQPQNAPAEAVQQPRSCTTQAQPSQPSPPRPPSPSSPDQRPSQSQPLPITPSQPPPPAHPHHHHYHHGRTLSLEAWHAVMNAEDSTEVELPVRGGTLPGRLAGVTGPFDGFAELGSRDATSPDVAPSSAEVSAPPLAAPISSPTQRGGVATMPSLAEELADPAPVPQGFASPRLPSSVAAAAGVMAVATAATATAAASVARLPPGISPDAAEGGSGYGDSDDTDADVEEDPALLLVAGPTVGGRGAVLRSLSATISDGEHAHSVDGDDDDDDGTANGAAFANSDADADADVGGGREQERVDDSEDGQDDVYYPSSGYSSMRRAAGSVGDAPAVAAVAAAAAASVSSSCSSASRTGSFSSSTRAAPPPPPPTSGARSSAAVVVGGGRWQGISTHLVASGTLHSSGSAVLAAQFSPGNGHNVATGAADGSLAIWSPSTALASSSSPREARLSCGAPITCVAWDGRADKVMLVGTAGRGILAWHADTRRVASEIPPDPSVPWVSVLACSRKDPVFIVAAATAPPLRFRRLVMAATTAPGVPSSSSSSSSSPSTHRVLSATQVSPLPQHRGHPAAHLTVPSQSQRALAGSTSIAGNSRDSSCGLGHGSSSTNSSGRLSLWNMRAFKRVSNYTVPQNSPVLSLAFNAQGSWFAAGTCCGDVHLYDSSSPLTRQQPLSSFRANSASGSTAATPVSAPAAVQVYDSAAETVLVTCCGATVRLWSLRRLVEPMLSVPLLPYLPYGGGSSVGWSTDWVPCMCLSPRGAAAAVVLGGGCPAVYIVDLQGNSAEEAAGGGDGSSGSGGSSWLSGVLGSPSASGLPIPISPVATMNRMAAAAAGRVSVILPYSGFTVHGGGGSGADVGCRMRLDTAGASALPYELGCNGGGDREDGLVYGTSCSWHPTRDVVVVGYSDGAVQTVGLSRGVGGGP